MRIGQKFAAKVHRIGEKARLVGRLAQKVSSLPTFLVGEDVKKAAEDVGGLAGKVGSKADQAEGILTPGGLHQPHQKAQVGGLVAAAKPVVSALARGAASHLATHRIGSGAKILHQAHEQLRSRDIISEGGALTRSAGRHLRRFGSQLEGKGRVPFQSPLR
jgi:hypothetical protein